MDFGEDYIVLDNNDIGYKIHTSNNSIGSIKDHKEKIALYTVLIHREDDMCLYGFSSKKELTLFQMLITVSGVGAKLALAILSSIPFENLISMIISEDINGLIKAQGVGKKTAQRLVLELKEKVSKNFGVHVENLILAPGFGSHIDEVIAALTSLGYGKSEAERAVIEVNEEGLSIEVAIRKALKILAK